MSFFLPKLKQDGHLNNLYITVAIVGSRKIVNKDDYGNQGWQTFAPNLTIYGFDADTEACQLANSDLESRQVNWQEKHIPLGLWDTVGKATLYITQFPGCSSLYPPSESYIQRYVGNSELIRLANTQEVETTTLDIFCETEGVQEIDFIQLDVQGGKLNVLKGAKSIIKNSVLGVITEVEFTELYSQQPLFGDIDVYLRNQGFTLLDLTHLHRDIRRVPLTSKEHHGSLIWGDAFYFKDLIKEDKSQNKPDKILKLACLADVNNFIDYALELLVYLTVTYGQDVKYNFADVIIASLANMPDIVNEGLLSIPIIQKVISYSISYPLIGNNISTEYVLKHRDVWQKQAEQCVILDAYQEAIVLYEQAIELEPDVKSYYWHLGKILLLQGKELEAQTTWLLGMADGEPSEVNIWITELIELLQKEVQRQQLLKRDDFAEAIKAHIQEIAPEHTLNETKTLKYSHLDEEAVIKKYIPKLNLEHEYFVDIAASDGLTMSNTYFLAQKGWFGLSVEGDPHQFAALSHNYRNFSRINLSKCMITPDNVVALLTGNQVPQNFSLLNLDIDGYDYFVLDKILLAFRPSMICVEINEKIPPPLKFTIKYDPNYIWNNDHFYGQSICQLYTLCQKHKYSLVELHYNNAFLMPQENTSIPSISPEIAYQEGYLNRPDRHQKFPWNHNVEEIHSLAPEEALNYINKFFAKYQGKFDCSL